MRYALLLPLLLAAAPAHADVVQSTATSFELTQAITLDVPIARAWATLRAPQLWWDKEHSYSGDAANLYLDATCFCERLPDVKGRIEHARIVYVAPGRMIRLVGSLGPLQAEAVTGTLTFKLDPEGEKATRVTMSYVVGGYVRAGADTIAPKVDEVLAVQMVNLKSAAEAPTPVKDSEITR